jgi:hypothetical protein
VAHPVTIGGRPYLVEVDEFSGTDDSNGPASNGSKVGAARIIDIADERAPRVVSNIRLAVHQPENREQLANDPGATSVVQGYAGHYCTVPQREEPGILACSFIASGLRVFDIRDPERPKELAYFTAPAGPSSTAGPSSNFAMSGPAFDPDSGRGLVLGRQHRLLRASHGGGRLAVRPGRQLCRPPSTGDDAAPQRPAARTPGTDRSRPRPRVGVVP